ncbi:hypothetical protein OEZ85_011403 [Tetradesmus obliquus]|uniref:SBP-type domain-containing protein n=1 Tax=Tetradesmus obliquus TaxID=3088 RepID=A0ABY8TQ92_TETOB|nr:hypothetical protein OEZ85_011403 [Tetradesmus obliquus]
MRASVVAWHASTVLAGPSNFSRQHGAIGRWLGMEPSYDSSEWAIDDESQRISQKYLCKPRPKRVCQVPGCTADLEATGKPYCSVKRICPIHMKADIIPVRNQIMRFCQQCGVLEPLSLFDFTKRSCRDSLSRRVKHTPAESEQRPKPEISMLRFESAGREADGKQASCCEPKRRFAVCKTVAPFSWLTEMRSSGVRMSECVA